MTLIQSFLTAILLVLIMSIAVFLMLAALYINCIIFKYSIPLGIFTSLFSFITFVIYIDPS